MKAPIITKFGVFIVALCVVNVFGQDFDYNNLKGCYIKDPYKFQFTAYVSHLDATTITPASCLRACRSMKYRMAAIKDNKYCFCKESFTNTLVLSSGNSNCAVPCPSNANIYCGAVGFVLVYEVPPTYTVKFNKNDLLFNISQ
jgi:hypothetical protein